jgi:hypothetical protein
LDFIKDIGEIPGKLFVNKGVFYDLKGVEIQFCFYIGGKILLEEAACYFPGIEKILEFLIVLANDRFLRRFFFFHDIIIKAVAIVVNYENSHKGTKAQRNTKGLLLKNPW